MTRYGFFLFNLLLVSAIYGLVWLNGGKHDSAGYAMRNFSEPYIALVFIMILLTSIRWFMSHDADVEREIVTWAHALWFVPVITIIALYFNGQISMNVVNDLKGLATLR